MSSALKWLVTETGLLTLWHAPGDVKLLCAQRVVRFIAFGGSSLILALHLQDLGFRDELVGLFMSLTLLGDVCISLVLTIFADALGRKNILVVGSLLMAMSGVVFGTVSNYWALLAAAVFGVIAPSGSEIGPFRAIEESILAQLAPKERRSDIFAWYTLLGLLGAAFGQIVFGWVIDRLNHQGWTLLQAYRLTFLTYAGLGLLKLVLALCLSAKAELKADPPPIAEATGVDDDHANDPTRPLLADQPPHEDQPDANAPQQEAAADDSPSPSTPAKRRKLLPSISRESRAIVIKLCVLFAVDSFASGLVTVSYTAVFFADKFGMTAGALGTLFFSTSIVAALSNLVSASLARRIGLLRTMVFTHLPSSLFLALVPVPQSRAAAVALMVARYCTATMDTAPRQGFLAAAVLDAERTAVMGVVNVVRILAQAGGPYAAGALRAADRFGLIFVLSGALKAGYDFGLLGMFLGFKARA